MKDKIILLTGCNGTLANKIVEVFSKEGFYIIGCDTHEPDSIKSENSATIGLKKYFNCDLENLKSIELMLNELQNIDLIPNILINNAAIDFVPAQNTQIVTGLELENFDKIFRINLRAPIYLAQKLSQIWINNNCNGSIINLSSIYSLVSPDPSIYDQGFLKNVLYGASKAALNSVSQQLSVIYANKNIRINTLIFSGVKSPLQTESFVKNYSNRIPIKRLMNVNEIIPSIRLLLDEENSYMNGSQIIVDGSYTNI